MEVFDNNQYRGTYIDYMTDDEDEEDQVNPSQDFQLNDRVGKYEYISSTDRNISEMAFEETNSFIN